MEREARGNLIFSPVTSKQGNISSNTREKRTSFKLSLFIQCVISLRPAVFIARVPHLNNTFSESDRVAPLPGDPTCTLTCSRARKLCLVHVKHREWSRVPMSFLLPHPHPPPPSVTTRTVSREIQRSRMRILGEVS